MTENSHQIRHYFPLVGLLMAGVLGFAMFSFDKVFQFVVALAVSLGYVSWGVVHHYLHKDLYPEVIFEYIIVATLGLILIFSVIFRA